MEIDYKEKVVYNCERCGWDHLNVEFDRVGTSVKFTCQVTRKPVEAKLDALEVVSAILGREVIKCQEN